MRGGAPAQLFYRSLIEAEDAQLGLGSFLVYLWSP